MTEEQIQAELANFEKEVEINNNSASPISEHDINVKRIILNARMDAERQLNKFNEQKEKEIAAIIEDQKELIQRAAQLVNTDIAQAMVLIMQARMLESERLIILSQPFPKYKPGGPSAVVGESIQSEVIKGPDGSIYFSRNEKFFNLPERH